MATASGEGEEEEKVEEVITPTTTTTMMMMTKCDSIKKVIVSHSSTIGQQIDRNTTRNTIAHSETNNRVSRQLPPPPLPTSCVFGRDIVDDKKDDLNEMLIDNLLEPTSQSYCTKPATSTASFGRANKLAELPPTTGAVTMSSATVGAATTSTEVSMLDATGITAKTTMPVGIDCTSGSVGIDDESHSMDAGQDEKECEEEEAGEKQSKATALEGEHQRFAASICYTSSSPPSSSRHKNSAASNFGPVESEEMRSDEFAGCERRQLLAAAVKHCDENEADEHWQRSAQWNASGNAELRQPQLQQQQQLTTHRSKEENLAHSCCCCCPTCSTNSKLTATATTATATSSERENKNKKQSRKFDAESKAEAKRHEESDCERTLAVRATAGAASKSVPPPLPPLPPPSNKCFNSAFTSTNTTKNLDSLAPPPPAHTIDEGEFCLLQQATEAVAREAEVAVAVDRAAIESSSGYAQLQSQPIGKEEEESHDNANYTYCAAQTTNSKLALPDNIPKQPQQQQQQREFQVEWTVGSKGRGSFRHALRSSVSYHHRKNESVASSSGACVSTTTTNDHDINNLNSNHKTTNTTNSISRTGHAIGRTFTKLVKHFSTAGSKRIDCQNQTQKLERKKSNKEEQENQLDHELRGATSGDLCDCERKYLTTDEERNFALSRLSHQNNPSNSLNKERHSSASVNTCHQAIHRENYCSELNSVSNKSDTRHPCVANSLHQVEENKLLRKRVLSSENELEKSNGLISRHRSNDLFIQSSNSCQCLTLTKRNTCYNKNQKQQFSSLELDTNNNSTHVHEIGVNQELEPSVTTSMAAKQESGEGIVWSGKVVSSSKKRKGRTTCENYFVRSKHLIEERIRQNKHKQQQVPMSKPTTQSSTGSGGGGVAGRDRYEERRSTYCSSIGVLTSDLNDEDSSYSSVNNYSESNNTCNMIHRQHDTNSEQAVAQQDRKGTRATASDRSHQPAGYSNDCNKSPSSGEDHHKDNKSNKNDDYNRSFSSGDGKRRKEDQNLGQHPHNHPHHHHLFLTHHQHHPHQVKERENWDKNIEFLLAVIGFAVDLGNVWRFPYICYTNGGGAFLIPYTIMFILGGLPIFYLEMSLGQYFSSGCLTVWKRVCPMAKGIGYAMCVLNFFTGLYYNTIISWAVFFFVESFTSVLPWTSCNNKWNSANCRTIDQRQGIIKSFSNTTLNSYQQQTNPTTNSSSDGLMSNLTQEYPQRQVHYASPTKDYFERKVLQIHMSSGIDDLGFVREPLAIYLAIVFICIYFAIWKGVRSTGKAVWITALLPYFVLIPLLIRGVFLEGAWLGIKYYLSPQWIKITDKDVWVEAAKQIYFSLGPGFGTLMALSSYNKFNHNCRRDTLIAASVNYFASFISGLVIFAVLGYMATIENVDISAVAAEGPGLVFQVYPEGLATMRFSSMWSVLFFLMVITLGIDSTFGGLESVITGLCDEYPRILRAHRGVFIGILIVLIYLCSLPTTTYGGNYVICLLESYGTSLSLLFIVLVETIIVCWLYGVDRFCKNLEEMYGETPGPYWRICWKYISPTILLLIFIAACRQELDKYQTLTNGDYTYPSWAPTVGLLMTGSSVCCIPLYALYYLKTKVSGTFFERLKTACRPIRDDIVAGEEKDNLFPEESRDANGNLIDVHLDTVI